jgi:hypothetical protein
VRRIPTRVLPHLHLSKLTSRDRVRKDLQRKLITLSSPYKRAKIFVAGSYVSHSRNSRSQKNKLAIRSGDGHTPLEISVGALMELHCNEIKQ